MPDRGRPGHRLRPDPRHWALFLLALVAACATQYAITVSAGKDYKEAMPQTVQRALRRLRALDWRDLPAAAASRVFGAPGPASEAARRRLDWIS
jgi:hypothetical protein